MDRLYHNEASTTIYTLAPPQQAPPTKDGSPLERWLEEYSTDGPWCVINSVSISCSISCGNEIEWRRVLNPSDTGATYKGSLKGTQDEKDREERRG